MNDLISRQQAIEIILSEKVDEDDSLVECAAECNSFIDKAADDIRKMSSVQPEQKYGRWGRVDYGNGLYNYHCSLCRYIPIDNIRSNFCPNCGAKMEETE